MKSEPVPPTYYIAGFEIESPKHKAVLNIPNGVIQPHHKVISVQGQLYVKNNCFAMSDPRCWTPINANEILELV